MSYRFPNIPLLFCLAVSVFLAACKPEPATPASGCHNNHQENLNRQVQDTFRQTIASEAQLLAAKDSYRFIDADKLIAAAAQLTVQSQTDSNGKNCRSNISITLPGHIWQQAQTNAPLLGLPTPSAILERCLNTLSENGSLKDNTLHFVLEYPENSDITATLNTHAKLLAKALSGYGVKELLETNGNVIRRENALQILQNTSHTIASPDCNTETLPVITLPDFSPSDNTTTAFPLPDNADLTLSGSPISNTAAPHTVLTPENGHRLNIGDNDVAAARQAHQAASAALIAAWNKISPEIQKDLFNEQKNWEKQRQQSCRSTAAQGSNDTETLYLLMQCDTRLTRERTRYLNGYSID